MSSSSPSSLSPSSNAIAGVVAVGAVVIIIVVVAVVVAWRLTQASRRVEGSCRCLTLPSYCRKRDGRVLELSASFVYRLHHKMFNIGNSDSAHRSYFVSSRSPSPFVFHRSHLFAVRSVSPLAICTTKNGDSSRTVDRRANRVEACQHHRLQQPIANAVPGLGHTQRESVEADRRRNQWAPGNGTGGLKINPSL